MIPRQGAALITGGAKRLGRGMALSLAARGYDLVIHYQSSQAEAELLQAQVKDFGSSAHLLQGDLKDPHFIKSLIADAQALCPALNLLVNNASVFYPKSLEQTEPQHLDEFYDLHLKAPLLLSRDFARLCGQGQIINLLDSQILKNPINYLPYILSKKSLQDLTLLSAKALGPRIRVNGIAPGYILPPVEGNPDDSQQWLEQTPLARTGELTDITQALEMLLDQSFLTGQILWLDGGRRL